MRLLLLPAAKAYLRRPLARLRTPASHAAPLLFRPRRLRLQLVHLPLRGAEPRILREACGAAGPRPRQDVAHHAGRPKVRRSLRPLPAVEIELRGLLDVRPRRLPVVERQVDADADQRDRAHVLLPRLDSWNRRRQSLPRLTTSTVFSKHGTIIVSGMVISWLPPTSYSALRSAFRLEMSSSKTNRGNRTKTQNSKQANRTVPHRLPFASLCKGPKIAVSASPAGDGNGKCSSDGGGGLDGSSCCHSSKQSLTTRVITTASSSPAVLQDRGVALLQEAEQGPPRRGLCEIPRRPSSMRLSASSLP
ncbi:unnamed protein product [Musa acuminata subsp. burmannicoides]